MRYKRICSRFTPKFNSRLRRKRRQGRGVRFAVLRKKGFYETFVRNVPRGFDIDEDME